MIAAGTIALAACGGSGSKSSQPPPASPPPASTTGTTAAPPPPPSTGSQSPGALQAEAASAATGDIPDNQVFLVFHDGAAGYSIKYPEGWAQSGAGRSVTFRDKSNIIRILIVSGPAPTVAAVSRELKALKGASIQQQPQSTTIGGMTALKAVYSTQSAPSPVTGKRVTLGVDRYYLGHAGKVAIVDLGSPIAPVKVDNVDAYRLMIESFRWR
jgi:hypothetical protein